MPVSNKHGRALEYIICKELDEKNPNIVLTKRALEDQRKDKINFDNCPQSLKDSFADSASIINVWIVDYFSIKDSKIVTLERLPDKSGIKGHVTDIKLNIDGIIKNFSIKHRHEATKHPRMSNVPKWISVTDPETIKEYKAGLNSSWDNIMIKAKRICPTATTFKELNIAQKDFSDKEIYKPMCNLIADFLTANISNESQVESLFSFLVGSERFYKIIVFDSHIDVLDFSEKIIPQNVKISHFKNSYLIMDFDNGWQLSLRLHNAEKQITRSLKFDVRATKSKPVQIFNLKKGLP